MLITAGSKIAIYYALQTFVEPGDEVLILEPFWVSYSEQIRLVGGTPRSVPIHTKIEEIEQFIGSKTRVIVINNPQNPSGKNYTISELTALFDLARKHDLAIIADEAYSDFVTKEEEFVSLGRIDPSFERTVIVNSISKNFGISGWRIGYLIAAERVVDCALKMTQHTMTCAPTPLLLYLNHYFDSIIEVTKPQIAELLDKRSRVNADITRLGLTAEPGRSTFYFFLDISESSLPSVLFCDRLLKERFVVAVPGIGYGDSCDHHIRISIGTESEEKIREGLRSIRELIEETR